MPALTDAEPVSEVVAEDPNAIPLDLVDVPFDNMEDDDGVEVQYHYLDEPPLPLPPFPVDYLEAMADPNYYHQMAPPVPVAVPNGGDNHHHPADPVQQQQQQQPVHHPLNITVTVVVRHEFPPHAAAVTDYADRITRLETQSTELTRQIGDMQFRNDFIHDLWNGTL